MARFLFVGIVLFGASLGLGLSFTCPKTVHATAAADAPPAASRVGYVRMADLPPRMLKFKLKSDAMTQKRNESAQKMQKLKGDWESKKAALQAASANQKPALEFAATAAQRAFEDAEKTERTVIDAESLMMLKELHADIQKVLKALAKERNLDAVHGTPPLPTDPAARGNEPIAMNLFFRPCSMNLLYLREGLDLTDDLIERLNEKFLEDRAAALKD